MSMMVTSAYAQVADLGAVGRQGQAFGNELITQWKNNKPSASGNVLSMPGAGGSLQMNDLYPGTSSGNKKPGSFYFPDEYEKDKGKYESIYDSGSAMDSAGGNAQGVLWADATKDNPTSLQGNAYKIILDTMNRSRPDMSKDPMFDTTRDVVANMDEWKKEFGDCSSETKVTQTTKKTHVPEYETCERVTDKSSQCKITHEYDAGVVKHYSGPLNLDSCGEGCTYMWIGQTGDNYWGGWCTIHEASTAVTVINPDAITSAVLDYVEYDDYMQVWVGEPGKEVKIFNGPNGNFPPETAGACELSTSWKQYPGIDVTNLFKNAKKDQVVNFKIRVSVADAGEGFGRIRIYYDTKKVITKNKWTPENCIGAALGVEDGFANGSVICTDDPSIPNGCSLEKVDGQRKLLCEVCSTDNETGETACGKQYKPYNPCVVINGVQVCESHLGDAPIGSTSGLCRSVEVNSDFDFYKGQMGCWKDPEGNDVCPDNAGGRLNTCGDYDKNPKCGYISSTCVEGALGASGQCYVWEDKYDCGYDVDVPNFQKEQIYQCDGPIKCMGTECIDVGWDQNGDFGKAAALLNAAQFMAQDMACSGLDENGAPTGEQDVICKVFPGEAGQCKKAVGGVVNCCEKPSGISLADYVTLLMSVPKLDAAITAVGNIGGGNAIGSSYQALKDPIMKGWSEISKPFVNATDGISGVFDKIGQAYDSVMQGLQDSIASLYDKAFGTMAAEGGVGTGLGEAAGGAGALAGEEAGKEAASEAAQQFASKAMGVISFIGTVYTIYSVTMLAIKMIYKCTEDELSLNVKRSLKSCSYVGSYCASEVLGVCIEKRESYCCFASPLSRIIQEQARPQLGMSFGDPESPSCDGLTVDQIANLDWDKINLDEWLGILQSTGNWAAGGNLDIKSLTGANTTLDLGSRVDAEERAQKRLEETDVDAKRIELEHTYRPYQGG